MSAGEDVLFEVIRAGGDLRERHGHLEYGPPDAVGPDLAREIARNRDALLDLIAFDEDEAERIGEDVKATLQELIPPDSPLAPLMRPYVWQLCLAREERSMIALRVAAYNVIHNARYLASGGSDDG